MPCWLRGLRHDDDVVGSTDLSLRHRVPRQLLEEHYGRCDDVQSVPKRVEPCWIDIDISVRLQPRLRQGSQRGSALDLCAVPTGNVWCSSVVLQPLPCG